MGAGGRELPLPHAVDPTAGGGKVVAVHGTAARGAVNQLPTPDWTVIVR